MNFQNPSLSRPSPSKTITSTQREDSPHRLSPQIQPNVLASLSHDMIPYKYLKQNPKNISKLLFPPFQSSPVFLVKILLAKSDIRRLKKTTQLMTGILTQLTLLLFTVTHFDLTYTLSQLKSLNS